MADDNTTVSMAQQALTGVNGGASVPAPEDVITAGSPGGTTTGLQSQVKSLLDIAKQTVAGLSRGLPVPFEAGSTWKGQQNPTTPVQPQRPTSLSGVLAEFLAQQNAAGVQQNQQPGGAARPVSVQSQNPTPDANRAVQTAAIDTRPVNERMMMIRPIGGGSAIPHYDYNGVSVALPDGVDVNDANAVGAAMAEQNALIDMMNGMNDEED